MPESFKLTIKAIAYNHPKSLGVIAFAMILALTMSISYVDYQLRISSEKERLHTKLSELEKRSVFALNNGISATKTLGYLAKNSDANSNFSEIGDEILSNNPYLDAIQLLDSGKIVAVYPLSGHEEVIGYDVLKDNSTKNEALEAIRRKEVFFAGPVNLRQGGKGIVGRLPIFKNGKFWGFSAVIIYLDTLLEVCNLQNSPESLYFIQLSKINPNSGITEDFLPAPPESKDYSFIKSTAGLDLGNLMLTVQLKESKAFSESIPVALLRILLSISLGLIAYSFAKQPSRLAEKVAEQSKTILKSNERFEYVTKATSDIIWDWDLTTNQVYRSNLFMDKFGYTDVAEINRVGFFTSIIHPDDLDQVNANLIASLESQDSYWEQEFRIQKADKNYVYIRDKGYIIRNPENVAVRIIGATEDITKRKLYELQLAEEKGKLENVISATESGTWEWNIQTGETIFNETWAQILGFELSELQPVSIETWKKFIHPDDIETSLKALEIHFQGAKDFYESELRMKHRNGKWIWILGRGKVFSWTNNGQPLMMFGTHFDITEKKAHEENQIIANQKLKNANEELQVFATLASHDMREPLRMISSFMALLQKKYGETLDQKANQYIHFAIDGAQRLTFLINDLLEYSKMGFDGENAEPIDTKKLIEEILPLKHRLIFEKDAKITFENLPKILAVKTPVRTLFRNLIGNALLFTREGVKPSIKIEGKETDDFWEFSIEDNGIGIEAGNLSHIFGMLNKVNLKSDCKRTGMGLTTAKKIVNQHGGSIWVKSTPLVGSTFFFTLKKI